MTLIEFVDHLKSKVTTKTKDDFLFYDVCGEVVERKLGDSNLQHPGALRILQENEAELIKLIRQRAWRKIKEVKRDRRRETPLSDDEHPVEEGIEWKMTNLYDQYDEIYLWILNLSKEIRDQIDQLGGKGTAAIFEIIVKYRPVKVTDEEISSRLSIPIRTVKRRIAWVRVNKEQITKIIEGSEKWPSPFDDRFGPFRRGHFPK